MVEDKPEYLSNPNRKPPKPPKKTGIGTAGFDDDNRRKKAANDTKRGAAFTKAIRAIISAAKEGGGDPNSNSLLKLATERAKNLNIPTVNIENAIKKGTGQLPGVAFEKTILDAYAPGGVALLIECLTDNKNRTTAEVRNMLTKNNGSMAGAGSTAWMFVEKGVITIKKKNNIDEEKLMQFVLEAGANDLGTYSDYYEITCESSSFETIKSAIQKKGIPLQSAEIMMVPTATVKISGRDAEQLVKLLESLQAHEDIQNVYANADIQK